MQDRFIIVSGLSGAGKTVALHALEDAGFYCVDNLPAGFLADFADFIAKSDLPHYRRVAVGIDARNPEADLRQLPAILDGLKKRLVNLELVFVEAGDQALINRFSETRRRHPLSSDDVPLRQAIAAERALLEPIIARADLRIDTSLTRLHEFRAQVNERVAKRKEGSLAVQFCSFGYKNGVPPDADFVFDVRCLPNPYWEPALRQHSGRDEPVARFLDATPAVGEMVADITSFLEKWIPRFELDQRSYLTVAIGCTGGRHRSVYIAEQLAAHFRSKRRIVLNHRDG
ncbi:MAG: RNase adapter RapZ [Gammaproteobacteria bacterium]|nr:RNase adapter RapZ [Gammaproteobacteria bacterium]MBI5617164.1 RNase adapter RapZ [Gammaproteobacteria bacterium]